jgi:hypothetical protein
MRKAERVPFTAVNAAMGEAGLLPMLSITLQHLDHSVSASGLLDTGAGELFHGI